MTNNTSLYINASSLASLEKYGIKQAAVAIGVFDGVHKGHCLLIQKLIEMAKRDNSTPVAMTFYPHPREALKPESHPGLLMSPAKKIELLHKEEIKAVVTIPFTREFASLSPLDFIERSLLSSQVELTGICVGKNWRFGAGGKGNVDILEDFAAKGHFDFESVDELLIDGETVSSTSIRRAISSGLLEKAGKMLGRPYSLEGEVEQGNKIAGTELSHPTANLKTRYGIIPPNGVYASCAILENQKYPAAVAVGVSPTFNYANNKNPRVEVHLIDFNGDIYGKNIEVVFVEYLREERCYSSVDALKQQIEEDINNVNKILKGRKI
jgi:riboflavin kinase/FMN adenylyltransferase